VVTISERSATIDTFARSEGIIFPNEQYLRLTELRSNQETNEIVNDELIDQWAKETSIDAEASALEYLGEQVSVVIFGNFDANTRSSFIREMQEKEIYKGNFEDAIVEELENGEKVITYSLRLQLKPFAEILNKTFERAGYGEFPPLSPDNYAKDDDLPIIVRVRASDNSVAEISFAQRVEAYDNYGVNVNVERPEATRSVEELQGALQQLFTR
jgi:hypothetical protein